MLFPKPLTEVFSEGKYNLKTYEKSFDAVAFFNTYGKPGEDVCLVLDEALKKEEYYITVSERGVRPELHQHRR